jgi:hypothetical protein
MVIPSPVVHKRMTASRSRLRRTRQEHEKGH